MPIFGVGIGVGEIQLIGFIWLALVLWLGAAGHWGLFVELGGGWGHGAEVNAHGCIINETTI